MRGYIPYPIAFGGGSDGAQLDKDAELDFVDYQTTIMRSRGSDAYDFKQDRHTGKILKQPKNDQPGVIEVVINGTTVFCEYDHADIVVQAGPETFAAGKRADFFYAKCQNSNAKKKNPARAKLIVPYGTRRYRGQVSTLKPGYGFIKRLSVDREIFFHITEVQVAGSGDHHAQQSTLNVAQGDKVDFSVTIRDGREVASQIYILPRHFPMEFDEISEHEYQGTIVRPCDKKDASQPQRGIIRIDGIIVGDSLMPDIAERIEYNERDRSQHSFTLIENDKVTFNKAKDKRSGKKRAINIRIEKIAESEQEQKREKGIVAVVKGSYGFIKRDRDRNDKTANESRIFFHLSEMLDANAKTGRRRIKKGCEVEFTVLEDPIPKMDQKGKMHATRIVLLKPAKYEPPTVSNVASSSSSSFNNNKTHQQREKIVVEHQMELMKPPSPNTNELITSEPIYGFIEHVASAEQQGVIRLERHMGGGEGGVGVAAPRVKYTLQALDDANLKWFKEAPECFDVGRGDYVQFNLEHGQAQALRKRYKAGRVKLKDTYGFLIYEGTSEPLLRCDDELFFHSNDASDFDQLEQGDLADFCIHYNERSGKYAADSVIKSRAASPKPRKYTPPRQSRPITVEF